MKPKKRLNKLSRTFYEKRLVAAYTPQTLDCAIVWMNYHAVDNSTNFDSTYQLDGGVRSIPNM